MSQESLAEGFEDLQMFSSQESMNSQDVVYKSVDKLLFEMLKDVRRNRRKYWENEIRKHLDKKRQTVKASRLSSENIIKRLKDSVTREFELHIRDPEHADTLQEMGEELSRLIAQYRDLNHRNLTTIHQIGKYLMLAKKQCVQEKITFKDFKERLNLPWNIDYLRFITNFYEFTETYTKLCYCGVSPDFMRRHFKKIKEFISSSEVEKAFWANL